jgi:hypothetical protein
MAEITATVTQEDLLLASTNLANPSVVESISQIGDVDTSTLVNGSVLVYKSNTNKWVSTTLLDQQHVEAGEF